MRFSRPAIHRPFPGKRSTGAAVVLVSLAAARCSATGAASRVEDASVASNSVNSANDVASDPVSAEAAGFGSVGTLESSAVHDIGVELPEGAPGTESGDLAVALNRMLGQIEGALAEQQGSEDRLRRFFADAAHARQVIANVVGNALVHTDPDVPVAIAVSSTADRVSVEVRDAGGGMSSEVTTRVTERFYRADPARSRHRGGSGLGLSIVDAAVSAHGGSVTIDSRPGAGTDVRLDFPRIERSIHTGSDAATDTDADVDRSTAGNS